MKDTELPIEVVGAVFTPMISLAQEIIDFIGCGKGRHWESQFSEIGDMTWKIEIGSHSALLDIHEFESMFALNLSAEYDGWHTENWGIANDSFASIILHFDVRVWIPTVKEEDSLPLSLKRVIRSEGDLLYEGQAGYLAESRKIRRKFEWARYTVNACPLDYPYMDWSNDNLKPDEEFERIVNSNELTAFWS